MTFETWQVTGWSLVNATEADQGLTRSEANEIAAPGALPRDRWVRPARGTGADLVVLESLSPGQVAIIPGSQGMPPESPDGAPTVASAVVPGQTLLVDADLLIRTSTPDAFRARTFRFEASGPGPETEELAAWHRQGYAFLRQSLAKDRVDALRQTLDRCFAEDVAAFGEHRLKRAGHYGAVRNLCALDPAFVDLLDNNPASRLVDQVLRPGYVLQTYDGLILTPGEGRYPWDFHTDLEALNGLAPCDGRVLAVNVLYYLDRTTRANGATYLVPHSHRSRLVRPPAEVLAACSVPAEGDAGDVLVFDSRLWHCAGNNGTDEMRRLIKTLFCEPWIRPAMDYGRAMAAERWGELTPRVRTLLGEQARPPASVADFRRLRLRVDR